MLIVEETKTQEAIKLFKDKEYQKSLKIFKTFKINFSKDEQKQIARAFEMISGNEKFYSQLGFKKQEELDKAIDIIKNKYKI